MQAVSAVTTTGIYCRPRCSAQPLPQHVREFPVAAAAEAAGYRACLRCRPYRVPPTADSAHPELVCRAVQMVLQGALDEETETELADRLAMSARHLRRLFMAHVGVSPDGLARSARTHFARRLLDDTDLTITEIAFATGFGSQRQFNRACQEVFRDSPSALRARRRRSDRLAADGGLALRLAFRGPLDWAAMSSLLAQTAIPGVENVDGDTYRRTIQMSGNAGVLELMPGGEDHLVMRAHLPHWDELVHVVRRARRIPNLDTDHHEPVRQLANDSVIGPLVGARPGLRVPGTWDAFETGVRAIIAEHATNETTTHLVGRLVDRYGSAVPGLEEMGLSHTFPAPEALAAADLRSLGLSQPTSAAIRSFATATVDGTLSLERGARLADLVDAVSGLPGIGPMAAHHLALRLGEPDAFPLSISPAAADSWRPWRALAVTHLWLAGSSSDTDSKKGAA